MHIRLLTCIIHVQTHRVCASSHRAVQLVYIAQTYWNILRSVRSYRDFVLDGYFLSHSNS